MKQLKPKSLFGVSAMILCSIVGCLNAGWWQTFGGAERDEGTCVQQTSDGGYIVTGVTWSFGRPGQSDIWLIKLDSLGHKEWDRTYEGGWGKSVQQTSDGGYIIAGSKLIKTNSTGDTLWTRLHEADCVQVTDDGGYIFSGIKSDAVWLLRLDENGDSLWAFIYSKIGDNGDRASWVEETSDGGYIITGFSAYIEEGEYRQRTSIFLMKTDADGSTLWTKTYGGEVWGILDRGNCVRQASDGGYIIAGLLDDPSNRWYCLIKTDSAGNIEWKSIEDGELHCVEQTSDGSYITVGATETATLSSSATPTGGNLWLIKTEENGDTVWTREYGGNETDAGRYVQQTSDSGYIITGYTYTYGSGGGDLYILKTDSLGLLTITEEPKSSSIVNWQVIQPVGSQITLRYWDSPFGFKATVFDVTGRQVDALSSQLSSGLLTWGQGFSSGVYFIKETTRLGASRTARVLIFH